MNVINFGKTNVHTMDLIHAYQLMSHVALIMVQYFSPVRMLSPKVNIVQTLKLHQEFHIYANKEHVQMLQIHLFLIVIVPNGNWVV